jgi:hypothetical protein
VPTAAKIREKEAFGGGRKRPANTATHRLSISPSFLGSIPTEYRHYERGDSYPPIPVLKGSTVRVRPKSELEMGMLAR